MGLGQKNGLPMKAAKKLPNQENRVPNKQSIARLAIGGLLVALILGGCASSPPPTPSKSHPRPYRVGRTWYQPLDHARDFQQEGIASWYGKKFHGRKTSSGETYNMYGMSAAHKTLPLGTYVRVKNLTNNKTIDVRINDRGPFVRGRIIDLSYGAAKKLNIVGPGTAPVEIYALGQASGRSESGSRLYVPMDYYSGKFTFQVGAFTDRRNAERLKRRLDPIYDNAHIATFSNGSEIFYRVRVGSCTTLEQAEKYEQRLVRNGYHEAFIVAE
jgi:rare lipoprotein A